MTARQDQVEDVADVPFAEHLRSLGVEWATEDVEAATHALHRLMPHDVRADGRVHRALIDIARQVVAGTSPAAPDLLAQSRARRIDEHPLGATARQHAARNLHERLRTPDRIDLEAELLLADATWRWEQLDELRAATTWSPPVPLPPFTEPPPP